MICEMVGGYIANSIALMSDAAHLLTDLIGFAISIISILIGTKKPTNNFNFGYSRAEVLGALGSIIIIWFLTLWLLYEAVYRLIYDTKVDGKIMFWISVLGLICNIVMAKVLHSGPGGHSHFGRKCAHNHDHGGNDHNSGNHA